MWLVTGLGNPGTQYALTRHNIGFMAVDVFAQGFEHRPSWKTEHKAFSLQIKAEEQVLLAKPQTFMNRSGESVQALMHFYKIPMENLVVIHDEVDIPFGKIRIHKNRGHGGHNGIRNIHELLGSSDYIRIKLGVGRPLNTNVPVADFVLQKFTDEEMQALPEILNRAGDALECLIAEGLGKASTLFNS